MNKSLEILKSIYKPLRYTIKGKATVLETTSGDFIIKEKNKDIKELYNYLRSRNFSFFPNLIDSSRKEVNVFEYINEINTPLEQKSEDLITLIASLHEKTAYFKEVSEDNYKTIYEDIKNNILFLKTYFNTLFEVYFKEIYMSPSQYLYMRNYSKIIASLEFCTDQLDEWYELVKNETKIRVSVVHNNLELNHFLKSDQDYLISWDNYKIDTPIIDLVNFYQKEYLNINFEILLEKYFNYFPLYEYEKKLLFILIAMPPVINEYDEEFIKVKEMRKKIDYVFKTEEILRPYYTQEEKEE